MTEAEWLACEEPKEMLNHLGKSVSQRKLRLFVCACYRAGEPWNDRANVASVDDLLPLAEQLADGIANEQDLQAAWDKYRQSRHPNRPRGPAPSSISLLLGDDAFHCASVGSDCAAVLIGMGEGTEDDPLAGITTERKKQTVSLREIFGNPFRTVTFDPAWRTDTAIALARQMYESREFSAMPILADALQDAGCDNKYILGHCREANATHVRGCWVVDLVLGKN